MTELPDASQWMAANKFKLNLDKTVILGSKYQRSKLEQFFPVNILGTLVKPADTIKHFGVWFDSEFIFSRNVQAICKSCFIHIRDLCRLRQLLSHTRCPYHGHKCLSWKLPLLLQLIVQSPYLQKVLGLNVLYKSIKFKSKTWLSPFVNTSPEVYLPSISRNYSMFKIVLLELSQIAPNSHT